MVPGLAQCESYVRALHADLPDEDGVTMDDRIKARLGRQQIYDKTDPPTVHFVLSESCLRRVWGGEAVMREQLDYLIKLSNRPNIMIQVMPFNAPPGRRSPIGTRFILLQIPSPGAAGPLELAYTEDDTEIRYLDDKKALAKREQAWTRMSTAALGFEESRAFMRQVARDFQ
ncbi:DUF5753 domain-containing protein [Actinophytocola xinjiangensis]|uniref:DUF5753 domain-containing protein n=1 Tax=Actinophytocola xinjiangensis TaxID=485602 RepID=UPI001FE7AA7F|nr:DUF5753 domain-containing protein [Actinophytocola xinjiangensis]